MCTEGIHLTWMLSATSSELPTFSDYISSSDSNTPILRRIIFTKITVLLKLYIVIGKHHPIYKQSIKGLIMVTVRNINVPNFDKVKVQLVLTNIGRRKEEIGSQLERWVDTKLCGRKMRDTKLMGPGMEV